MSERPRITILNGSLGGHEGNTAQAIATLARLLATHARVECVALAEANAIEEARELIPRSQAFVFATGTYWDSWGSPLQRLFEQCTDLEGTAAWLGKPAATIVTMHSVGGKEVLSRLQGVLGTLGLEIPPMTGLAHSLAGELARRSPAGGAHGEDLWSLDDLEIVAHNLLEALHSPRRAYRSWAVDRGDPSRRWINAPQ